MANIRTLQRSFSGGEISPEMFGRNDDAKYQSGLARCRNFITKPQGPAENRPGFAFVRAVKDSTKKVRLIPFTYSTTQTMVIEMGPGYFRFHTQGATLMSGGVPYEIANPYAEADLFDVHYVQSADVLTLVHPNYAPRELRRLGATNWQLTTLSFAASIAAPGAPSLSAAGHTSVKYTYYYVVTAVDSEGVSESAASASSSVGGNLFQTGATVTISWAAVTGASRYNVYKLQGGLYGYIGQTTGLSIVDDNISPDLGKTPPLYDSVFNGAGDYPGAVSYFEQRRCFAGTTNKPQNIWMTKSGTESNMSYSLPIRDDDRIAFRVAAREANTIRHIVPLTQLLLLTSSAEWRVTSVNSDAITPSTISVRPQSYVGSSNVQPVIINNTLIYGAARGGHVRELAYNWQASGFITGDLSLRAAHLFDTFDIVDMAYAKAPQPMVWFVSTSGRLLGLTYVPEQQVGAWHWHDTDGVFESCTVVAEGGEDALYCVIRRTINGASVRYVERMASRQFSDQADAFFVDCGATYSGVPADVISGLGHLEGKTVSILADGAVHPQRVVTGGSITLDIEASTVQIGLPIEADLQTLPLAVQLQDGSFGQGRFKNVNKVWLRVYRSSGIFVGPSVSELTEAKQRTTENYGAPPALKSEEIPLVLTPSWADSGQIFVRQSDPLPLTVVSLTAEVALGG
ncbi:phage protein [Bordetella parapertussis]|uniref:Phage protein n=1 Tax=Bordetella parapertussis (strain Bpp5) TaxID=1208660 RepID=K0ME22_BORPB|nr:phage protein [Bordetella parapertussis]CCJ48970.1 Phage protein [Bordetella parapertussis Bpp5]